jgi:hypothetical protein
MATMNFSDQRASISFLRHAGKTAHPMNNAVQRFPYKGNVHRCGLVYLSNTFSTWPTFF